MACEGSQYVALEQVSDSETIEYVEKVISKQWGFKLSEVEYAEREGHLKSISKVSSTLKPPLGLHRYVLRDLSLLCASQTANIVGYIETLTRKAWRIDGKDRVLKEVACSTVGCVFTFPDHRNEGIASFSLKSINEILQKRIGTDGIMNLFSGVGEFYSRFGYKSYHVPSHTISIDGLTINHTDDFKFLEYANYEHLIIAQAEYTQKVLHNMSSELKDNETVVALIPTTETFSWINDKDIFDASAIHNGKRISKFGAQLLGTNNHVLWMHNWMEEKLYITKLFVGNENDLDSLKELIGITISEAKRENLKSIFLWDTSLGEDPTYHKKALDYIKQLPNVEINQSQRNISLPAIRLNEQNEQHIVAWVDNNYWGWGV